MSNLVLCVNSATDWKIVDTQGKEYTPAEARALFEAGKVMDYNLAFYRLHSYDWNIDRLKEYYRVGIGR